MKKAVAEGGCGVVLQRTPSRRDPYVGFALVAPGQRLCGRELSLSTRTSTTREVKRIECLNIGAKRESAVEVIVRHVERLEREQELLFQPAGRGYVADQVPQANGRDSDIYCQ